MTDKLIEPIDASLDDVAKAVVSGLGTGVKPKKNNELAVVPPRLGTTPDLREAP